MERSSITSSSLPLTLGGVGVGCALRIRDAAHWGSWADCLEMVRARHPQVAEDIIRGMQGRVSDCLSAVQDCAAHLQNVEVQLPTWEALAGGVRPATSLEEEREPSEARGWQKHASVSVQSHHGPLSSVPFTAMLTNRVTLFEAEQSESCCSDASVCLCPCLFAPAGVAVFSTPLATTEQCAADQGFWAAEGLRWRVLLLRFAGKAVHECPPT